MAQIKPIFGYYDWIHRHLCEEIIIIIIIIITTIIIIIIIIIIIRKVKVRMGSRS